MFGDGQYWGKEGEAEVIQTYNCQLDNSTDISYREALAAVSIFEGKKKNSMAWNPDLVIGSSVRIPISGFKWVSLRCELGFCCYLN